MQYLACLGLRGWFLSHMIQSLHRNGGMFCISDWWLRKERWMPWTWKHDGNCRLARTWRSEILVRGTQQNIYGARSQRRDSYRNLRHLKQPSMWESGDGGTHRPREDAASEKTREDFILDWMVLVFPGTYPVCETRWGGCFSKCKIFDKSPQRIESNKETWPTERNIRNLQKLTLRKHRLQSFETNTSKYLS